MKVKLVATTNIEEDYIHHLMSVHGSESTAKEFMANVNKPEGLMMYIARVSSPKQSNPNYDKLLKYCAKHGHWSVFEQIDATFEVETSRAIATQILRHRSATFQEFSQRYSKVNMGFELYEARSQDTKNRQNSVDDMSDEDKQWFKEAQEKVWNTAYTTYCEALDKGIAKELSRFLLPGNTKTRLYMKNNLRNWLHYVNLRSANGTQEEHAEIAREIGRLLKLKFPVFGTLLEI